MDKKMISHDSVVAREPDHLTSRIDVDESVILNVEAGAYYGLNEVASRIWELMVEPQPVYGILHQLQQEYAIDLETCEREVLACLQQLADEGLIRLIHE